MKHLIKFNVVLLLAGLAISACNAQTTPEKQSKFELLIFEKVKGVVDDYYTDPLQPLSALKAANPKDALSIIGMDQIEKYNWDLQTITLTKAATDQLVEALASKSGASQENLKKFKEMMTNAGMGNPLELSLYIHPFAVRVDDQFKYGGIFLDAISQRPVDYPVIRVTISNGKAVFALLPSHLLFTMIDPVDENGKSRAVEVAPAAKTDVEQMSIFPTLSAAQSTNDATENFRKMIWDQSIKQIFEKAGKLK